MGQIRFRRKQPQTDASFLSPFSGLKTENFIYHRSLSNVLRRVGVRSSAGFYPGQGVQPNVKGPHVSHSLRTTFKNEERIQRNVPIANYKKRAQRAEEYILNDDRIPEENIKIPSRFLTAYDVSDARRTIFLQKIRPLLAEFKPIESALTERDHISAQPNQFTTVR